MSDVAVSVAFSASMYQFRSQFDRFRYIDAFGRCR